MDTSIIINLYFHLYPALLLYGGAHVPIIPVGNIFDQVEPKKWEKLLLAFSKLLTLIVNNRKLDDTLETTSDIAAFKAAHMFQSCLSLTKKEDLPFVVNYLLGNKGYSGGSRNDTGFDLYAAFERRMDGGGPTENAAAPGSAPSPASPAASSALAASPAASPAASSALVVRDILGSDVSNLESMMARGLNIDNAGEVLRQAREMVDAAARLHSLRDEEALASELSESGPYSTAKLNALLRSLTTTVNEDIEKLEKFSRAFERTNFRINNINNPLSSIDFSNIKGNPRLRRIVRLIDAVLKQNPIQGEINKAKIQRRKLKNQLVRKMYDRLVLFALATTIVVGVGVAYYATPMTEPEPTPTPTPEPAASSALDFVKSTFMAGGRWMWNKGVFGAAGVGIRKVVTATGSSVKDFIGQATGIAPLTEYVISNVQTGVNFLRANFGRLRNTAGVLGIGAVGIINAPLLIDYTRAKSNLLQVEEDERELLSKFRNTFVNLMITKYKEKLNSEINQFKLAILHHRREFAMLLRVSSMEGILELYENSLDTSIKQLGFNNLALLLNRSDYSRFQADMTSLLESNKGLSVQIVRDFFTKLSAADTVFTTLSLVPLGTVKGIAESLADLTRLTGTLATSALTLGAGAAASAMFARASGAAMAARGGPSPDAVSLASALRDRDPRLLPENLPGAASSLALSLDELSLDELSSAVAFNQARSAGHGLGAAARMARLSLKNRGGSRTRKLKKHTKLTRRRY